MLVNTKYRSKEEELMDDFMMEGPALEKTLHDIAKLNRWLGGNRITVEGVQHLLTNTSKNKCHTIVDVGCGNGDMLRSLSQWGKQKGYSLDLIGIDANAFTIEKAQELSRSYPDISYQCIDIFNPRYAQQHFDIILCTLTLHHFNDHEIMRLLKLFKQQAKVGVVINDLQRSRWAYYAFRIICTLWIRNPMARYDGSISILKGFTKSELHVLSQIFSNHKKQLIRWRWAFRYQWIISF